MAVICTKQPLRPPASAWSPSFQIMWVKPFAQGHSVRDWDEAVLEPPTLWLSVDLLSCSCPLLPSALTFYSSVSFCSSMRGFSLTRSLGSIISPETAVACWQRQQSGRRQLEPLVSWVAIPWLQFLIGMKTRNVPPSLS